MSFDTLTIEMHTAVYIIHLKELFNKPDMSFTYLSLITGDKVVFNGVFLSLLFGMHIALKIVIVKNTYVSH